MINCLKLEGLIDDLVEAGDVEGREVQVRPVADLGYEIVLDGQVLAHIPAHWIQTP